MTINDITNACLEVIFSLFLIQILAEFLLGIDIIGGIQELWHKAINKLFDKKKKIKSDDPE